MSVYLIAQLTINDREEYSQYEQGFMDVFAKFEGELLSVDEAPTVIEGEWTATRSVLIRFPTAHAAAAWYNSEDYQSIARHRWAASSGNIIMVNGF